jgi:hypothetical protein
MLANSWVGLLLIGIYQPRFVKGVIVKSIHSCCREYISQCDKRRTGANLVVLYVFESLSQKPYGCQFRGRLVHLFNARGLDATKSVTGDEMMRPALLPKFEGFENKHRPCQKCVTMQFVSDLFRS